MNDPTELSDAQCDEFRRHIGSFNSMVRHIYETGYHEGATVGEDEKDKIYSVGYNEGYLNACQTFYLNGVPVPKIHASTEQETESKKIS